MTEKNLAEQAIDKWPVRFRKACYAIHLFDGHTVWTPSQKLWALAITDNSPIGMASLCEIEGYDCLWISDVLVVEQFRRRGIATALIARLEAVAQSRLCASIAVGIDVLNTASLRLFAAKGYSEYNRSAHQEGSSPSVAVAWLSKSLYCYSIGKAEQEAFTKGSH